MKRLFTLLFTFITVMTMMTGSCAAAERSEREWLKNYGIDPSCSNPVFTRPTRTVPGGRKEGAGICMDDGQAYTNSSWVEMSHEWHYAPKLSYCKEEMATIYKVGGLSKQASDNGIEIGLKMAVRPINSCGAFVVYRNTRARQWDDARTEQYIATYDGEGHLVDAMLMGVTGDANDLFAVEPHGDYSMKHTWQMQSYLKWADESHFEIYRRVSYIDPARPNQTMWRTVITWHYSITPGNHIRYEGMTTDEEMPAVNPLALRLLDIMSRPLADAETRALFTKLRKEAKGIEALTPYINRMSQMLANWK